MPKKRSSRRSSRPSRRSGRHEPIHPRLGPIGRRGPIWYRYSVLYRDTPGGRIKREIVDSTSREDAIIAVRVMHPHAVDLAAARGEKSK